MPASAIAPAPSAPPPPPAAAPPKPAASPAPGKTAQPPNGAAAAPGAVPPAPGAPRTPMADSFDVLDRFATEEPANIRKPGQPAELPEKPAAPAKPAGEVTPPAPEGQETTPGTEPPKPGEKPKASPWKLVDTYKNRVTQLEKEMADLRANPTARPEYKEITDKLTATEKRAQELEEEIRYVNYSKSKEFAEQYQKPYEEAWGKAVAELKELTVDLEDGTSRPATAQDLVALANMSLKEARATAKAWFGDCSDDIIAHRRIIRDLSERQNKALEEARTKSGEREKQRAEQFQRANQAMDQEVSTLWKTVNEEAAAKYDFLKPVDGEPERNEKLQKAVAFVDEAFGQSARDPRLTPEQRAEVIKKHAALRNRAIAYSPLLYENKKLRAQLAEKEKALAAYQQSEPGRANGAPPANGELPTGDPMAQALAQITALGR